MLVRQLFSAERLLYRVRVHKCAYGVYTMLLTTKLRLFTVLIACLYTYLFPHRKTFHTLQLHHQSVQHSHTLWLNGNCIFDLCFLVQSFSLLLIRPTKLRMKKRKYNFTLSWSRKTVVRRIKSVEPHEKRRKNSNGMIRTE